MIGFCGSCSGQNQEWSLLPSLLALCSFQGCFMEAGALEPG